MSVHAFSPLPNAVMSLPGAPPIEKFVLEVSGMKRAFRPASLKALGVGGE